MIAVGVGRALGLGRRHVQLLLDDGRADGGKADDQRDDLQVARRAQQSQRFGAADALLFAGLARVRCAGASLAPDDRTHDRRCRAPAWPRSPAASCWCRCARRATPVSAAPARRPGCAPPPIEAEQPLGLARVVDVVGQRPELADQQDAEDQAEQVERRPRPTRSSGLAEEHPERRPAATTMPGCVTGIIQRRGTSAMTRRVALHDEADDHAGAELDPRQVVGAQVRDELPRVTGLSML